MSEIYRVWLSVKILKLKFKYGIWWYWLQQIWLAGNVVISVNYPLLVYIHLSISTIKNVCITYKLCLHFIVYLNKCLSSNQMFICSPVRYFNCQPNIILSLQFHKMIVRLSIVYIGKISCHVITRTIFHNIQFSFGFYISYTLIVLYKYYPNNYSQNQNNVRILSIQYLFNTYLSSIHTHYKNTNNFYNLCNNVRYYQPHLITLTY